MIAEIPLDAGTITEAITETITENVINLDELEENPCINPEELIPETINSEPEIPKRPRGRPKGSAKPKPAAKPKAAPPPKEQKMKPKPKKKKEVQYESSSDEDLPAYVRQEVAPERDLATQMLKLLQGHATVKAARQRQLYSSWFAHH